VQLFTSAGHCGFASTNVLTPAEASESVRRASALAESAAAVGAESSRAVFGLQREPSSGHPCSARRLDATPQSERRAALLEAHREVLELAGGFAVRSTLSLVEDEWRITRSDGTDVRFRLPRGMVRHAFTGRGGGEAASAACSVAGADDRVLLDPADRARLQLRAQTALRRVRDVVGAPSVSAGVYRVVLDHSMAKSLAHEAFGHAVETDVADTSIFATDGRLRLGERVANSDVSILDGSLDGDFAYQPISSSGGVRQTVEIIR